MGEFSCLFQRGFRKFQKTVQDASKKFHVAWSSNSNYTLKLITQTHIHPCTNNLNFSSKLFLFNNPFLVFQTATLCWGMPKFQMHFQLSTAQTGSATYLGTPGPTSCRRGVLASSCTDLELMRRRNLKLKRHWKPKPSYKLKFSFTRKMVRILYSEKTL